MPLFPTDAARTAAPVPPKTSQNVPKNSATAALPVFMCPPPNFRSRLLVIEGVVTRRLRFLPTGVAEKHMRLAGRHEANKKAPEWAPMKVMVAGAGFEPATFGL